MTYRTRTGKALTAAGVSAVVVSLALYLYQLWVAQGVLLAWASREDIERLPHYSRCIMWCASFQVALLLIVLVVSAWRVKRVTRRLEKREKA